jgi:4-hydroxybenzoyl-CoA reductase subunit beta
MILTQLTLERPRTKAELFEILEGASPQEELMLLAGGTDLIPALKRLPSTAKSRVVSLNAILELKAIEIHDDGSLNLGSGVTLSKLARDSRLQNTIPCLSETASLVASMQIQSRATIGGNLLVDNRCVNFNQNLRCKPKEQFCYKSQGESCLLIPGAIKPDQPLCRARFVSDLAPVLILLNAVLCIESSKGEFEIPLRDFYGCDGLKTSPLKRNEVLVSIKIPAGPKSKIAYRKLRIRDSLDFPSLGVALSLNHEHSEVRVAITGLDVLPKAFCLSRSKTTSETEMLEIICSNARRATPALKQDFFPPGYRKQMIEVFIRSLWNEL